MSSFSLAVVFAVALAPPAGASISACQPTIVSALRSIDLFLFHVSLIASTPFILTSLSVGRSSLSLGQYRLLFDLTR